MGKGKIHNKSKKKNIFHYITKSVFVRSVFLRVLSIFIVISLAIAAVAFFSFASEIKRNVLDDRFECLSGVENSISTRMAEITSIAYSISQDPDFYLEPVPGDNTTGRQMSNTLARYLVGNNFIEHLAYFRLSEPDKIYISTGERSLREFYMTSFGMSKEATEEIISNIIKNTRTTVVPIMYGEKSSYFAYLYPLPQLSANPQAFVMMLIPMKEVAPLCETLLTDSSGEIDVFDADGNLVYRVSELEETLDLSNYVKNGAAEEDYKSSGGERYVLQKVVSESNGWTYVSVIRNKDTLSGFANRQIIFIILLLAFVFIAVIAMLISIVSQYKPISNLAATVAEKSDGKKNNGIIDEGALLSNTIATLTDDSEQKQKFETAYHEAQAASRAKSAFLSNMSHDIRTPMNSVIGMTAIALQHADDPDYVRKCLQKVQVSSQYLMDIINNVLDMSRIESGRFTLTAEVVDLKKLTEGLVAIIETSAKAKSQKLNVKTSQLKQTMVIGDSVRLTQVFVNILSNAVKFTPKGGTINVSMVQTGNSEPDYGNYVFTFSDNGVGMSPEFVGKVFETFTRAEESNTPKVEGTGLGMAIAKNLVELMDGNIKCESELGRGTTFTVTMRMKYADAAEIKKSKAEYKQTHSDDSRNEIINLTGKHILLVEDNSVNREISTMIIDETKAKITEAVNGKEAVDIFGKNPVGYFDLILMDIQMPVMNGYEATVAIRNLDRADAKTVPIYAMTANTFDDDIRRVKAVGMNGHIGKPYAPPAIYRMLGQVFK